MRVLIISSEPLNPSNTLSSTFELTQAQVLSASYDVAILSVNLPDPLIVEIKLFIKKLIGLRSVSHISYISLWRSIWRTIFFLFFKNKFTREHTIEGIRVYEGVGYFFRGSTDFTVNLQRWLQTGAQAFETYSKKNGSPAVMHAHGRFLNAGVLARAIHKKNIIPYIYTEHCTYYQQGIAPPESKPLLAGVINKAAAFIVVSPSLKQQVEKFIGQKYERALVIPNVLDRIYENSPLTSSPGQDPFVFLTVALLDYKKGIDILLKAFKKAFTGNTKYQLKICGDGPLSHQLLVLRNELGLGNVVEFLGYQPKQSVKKLFDRANVFVLPSRVETFGVVIIEALSRGCPAISTRSGGPEYIIREDCGMIVEPGNVNELCSAMQDICNKRYDRLKIRDYAISHYGAGAFLAELAPVYEKIAGSGLRFEFIV